MIQFDNEQMQTFPRIFEIRKHNSWMEHIKFLTILKPYEKKDENRRDKS